MLPHIWRQSLSISRAVLGCASFAIFIMRSERAISILTGLLLLYMIYAVGAAAWRNLDGRAYSNVALLIDTLYLLVWISICISTPALWITILLYAYVMAEAVVLQDWRVVSALYIVTLTWTLLLIPVQYPILAPVIACTGALCVVFVLQKRYLEARLWNAARQSVLYRYDAQVARESERERIAADFHDGPLQSFISFQMRLEIIKKLMGRDAAAALDELRQLQDICKGQVNELRSFVRSMRPPEEGMSLSASLSRMVEQFQRDTGLSTSFTSGDFADPPETELSLEMLHLVREALNNVQKHSKATRVAVNIDKTDNCIEISIEDNGGGFPFSGAYNLDELELLRLGPTSIKRRVRILNGDLYVESRPGQGAGLKIRIPA